MEEVIFEAFNAFLSGQVKLIRQAEQFFNQQIKENPIFYEILFYSFNNSTNQQYKILSLILLKKMIRIKFSAIQQNFQQFSQLLVSSIGYTENKIILKYQAEIISIITSKINVIWEDFPNYLSLFRNQDTSNLLPFCVFLYNFCLKNTDILHKYSDFFNDVNPVIILCGLQSQDPEIQILSTYHFTQVALKCTDESVLSQYQGHYNIICQIAEKSIDMEYTNFLLFWGHILHIRSEISKPFFDLAHNFLQIETLHPYWRLELFQIIIKNYKFINQEELESIICGYFNAQIIAEIIDYDGKIFIYLSRINPDQTYELFKSILTNFLSSDEDFKQFLGIVNLRKFVSSYLNHITGDISPLIDLSLQIGRKSIESFTCMVEFFTCFLNWFQMSSNDIEKVTNLIIEAFLNQLDFDFLKGCQKICEKIGPNPIFFDKLIEIFDRVRPDSYPFYFSILLKVHSIENNMTNYKYDLFFKFLYEIFGQSSQKVNELSENCEEEEIENNEIKKQLYDSLLLRGFSANLIWLFSFFNPQILGKMTDASIESFINLLDVEDSKDLRHIDLFNPYLSLKDVKNDFAFVFKKAKIVTIEKIRNYYGEIGDGQDLDDLCSILFDIDLFGSPGIESILENFDDLFHWFDHEVKLTLEEINENMKEVILPLSKIIYKIPQIELHQNFLTYIKFMFKYTDYSSELWITLTKILQRTVKPKRASFNKENEWYLEMCKEMNSFIFDAILPSINKETFCISFKAFANLMMFFIYTGNDFGHSFLVDFIIHFYEKYSESSEIDLLILFSKMIDNNYFNENEINLMLQIINAIIKRGRIYFDSRPELFNLIAKISKLNSEISLQYFQFAFDLFNEIKNDHSQLDTKIYCSYFLFYSFNRNKNDFQAVVPLIPEILSVFPNEKLMIQFFDEMKTFLENSKDLVSKEILEVFIAALVRYLSYQNNAFIIFNFTEELNNELIALFKQITEFYCSNLKIDNIEELIKSILPEQQCSVQYILSLLQ